MKFTTQIVGMLAGASSISSVLAHPEPLTKANMASEFIGRGSSNCAAQIEARKVSMMEKRAASIQTRRQAEASRLGRRDEMSMIKRDKYATIQNDTCVLAPDTIFGPYAVDEEIFRHDIREGQDGVDFYLDFGVIDIETCEPLPNAYLTIWHCNATGSYSGFTGIDPDTAELYDGYTKQSDGTTDEETFLRGVMSTNTEGIAEFLSIFPGYYTTRGTHIHLTVQTNVTSESADDYSYSTASVQHVGQLYLPDSVIDSVYELSPYAAHLETLDRIANADDKLWADANANGYSALISTELIGDTVTDGIIGYVTVGVNTSATIATSGESVNPLGVIPTVSVASSVRAAATLVDVADGYVARKF